MNGTIETKSEIRARIHELEQFLQELHRDLAGAEEDVSSSIIRSHKAICKVKQMDEKAAYGNDPAMYYTLGICGEAGEMANAIVKATRNGADKDKVLDAIKGELPDVVIYAYVLAYVLDIDLSKLVNDKVEIVIQRANDGYYGSPLSK
jgi:NTP pyrophosphatase (non-canonical NTP hydrolase)